MASMDLEIWRSVLRIVFLRWEASHSEKTGLPVGPFWSMSVIIVISKISRSKSW